MSVFERKLRNPFRTFILAHRIRVSVILPWDRKSYLTHAILPRLSREGYIHWLYLTHAQRCQTTSLLS